MKRFLLILFCTLCILITGCGNNHPRIKKINNLKYHYVKFSPDTVDYLKNKSEYSELYKQGKKLVVYAHCDYCPYIKRIEFAVNELSKRPEYKDYYNFYLQDAPGYKTFESNKDMKAFTIFFNRCNSFCIVNTKTNELFTITGNRTVFADNLHYILDAVMRW